ncbi:MAG: HD family phosphohydrolase [Solirubrobacterales bacterium]
MRDRFINYFKDKENLKRSAIFLISFAFVFSVLATSLITKKYNLKEGDIAKADIKATREVQDETITNERRKMAADSVPLQFNKKTEVKAQVVKDVNDFFTILQETKGSTLDDASKLSSLKKRIPLNFSDEDFNYALNLSKDEALNTKEFLIITLEALYDSNTISDNTQQSNQDDIKRAQEFILIQVNNSKLSKASKEVASALGYAEIKPNFYYDKEKTEELKVEASKKVDPVMIKKDQTIVKEGEPVTKDQIKILETLGVINSNNSYPGFLYLSMGVMVVFVLALLWYYLYKFYRGIFFDTKKLIMINLLNCAAVLIARTVSIASPFLIPMAFIPMIFTLTVNYKVSLFSNILNVILISCAVNYNIEITLLAVANASVGAIILKKMNQRNDIMSATSYIAITNVILTFSIGFMISSNIIDVANNALFAFVASVLSGILTIGFLPFFESVFEVLTTIKLLELSNPNNPLLKRLLMEAPGTYHHSIIVGNLSETAAEAVGGDVIFVRTASCYHDVGKLKRPYFFKENQLENDNPHSRITPSLSTLIILSHIRDGAEIAREYKIPERIIDVIEQHHGTSLVKYFYLTVKNQSPNPDLVNEADFRYKGPIPDTRESGIIMLADAAEAAVRSIIDPDRNKIEAKVNEIIKSRLEDGQLDNCDLTLKDIDKIKKAFLKVFNGIYHSRIEYPMDKWEK